MCIRGRTRQQQQDDGPFRSPHTAVRALSNADAPCTSRLGRGANATPCMWGKKGDGRRIVLLMMPIKDFHQKENP